MLSRILSALKGAFSGRDEGREAADRKHFDELNRQAPIRNPGTPAAPAPVQTRPATAPAPEIDGFLCRESVLGRDQRVAGYQFMLHEGTRNRIRARGRRIQHVYAEVLARNLANADIGRLLGHRTAFLDVPDSFLDHASILDLPPRNTALVVTAIPEEDGAPALVDLLASTRSLRKAGYRIGLRAEQLDDDRAALLAECDYIVVQAAASEPEQLKQSVHRLRKAASKAELVARNLPSQDDFQLCHTLGAALFQGPFVTSRQDWHGNRLGPNTARLAQLISGLRGNADTRELVNLLKQDAALSLRLMRYINSAAVGLAKEITSIEGAILQLGREKLYRWLMLLLYGADKGGSPRAAAALENALVRARLMELLGEGRPPAQRDALYLVGLLSLVDVILEVPMAEAIASLSPAPEIEAAVLRDEGPMADLLQLAIACENGDPETLRSAAERCGIGPDTATRRHLDAFSWALEVNA
ncbi:EAL and HDOD domain-containing protein [Azoarcus sp. KH32C]|uniref:EAL and HDOD domain-containing protein n=1 Tax=Azoarcus sp. KH32C TaxID=748247 RepID=UPI00023863AE|nr:HDOD domain-containing protein [Azoarcus sp. KH32C]BAL24103.1 putative signal transduction protein [Azoarcus sp. KH32C]